MINLESLMLSQSVLLTSHNAPASSLCLVTVCRGEGRKVQSLVMDWVIVWEQLCVQLMGTVGGLDRITLNHILCTKEEEQY